MRRRSRRRGSGGCRSKRGCPRAIAAAPRTRCSGRGPRHGGQAIVGPEQAGGIPTTEPRPNQDRTGVGTHHHGSLTPARFPVV
ncbi:MAG TPA: hypothetical protein ENK11_03790 [Phycisphaerales bacterium]|nr:hypothetical protein [Phycisphaerales bacterium]